MTGEGGRWGRHGGIPKWTSLNRSNEWSHGDHLSPCEQTETTENIFFPHSVVVSKNWNIQCSNMSLKSVVYWADVGTSETNTILVTWLLWLTPLAEYSFISFYYCQYSHFILASLLSHMQIASHVSQFPCFVYWLSSYSFQVTFLLKILGISWKREFYVRSDITMWD